MAIYAEEILQSPAGCSNHTKLLFTRAFCEMRLIKQKQQHYYTVVHSVYLLPFDYTCIQWYMCAAFQFHSIKSSALRLSAH